MALPFEKSHNMPADFQIYPYNLAFAKILRWLQGSNLVHCLTTPVDVYENHITDFWNSAELVTINGVQQIQATVMNRDVVITEADIRRVLAFDDDGDTVVYSKERLMHIFRDHMGYQGVYDRGAFEKSMFPNEYRYVIHIVMNSLSSRKGGFSRLSHEYGSAVVAILYRLQYNFSRMIFNGLKYNLERTKGKFLLYPRFLQLVINDRLNDLPLTGDTLDFAKTKVFANICKKKKPNGRYHQVENFELLPWIEDPVNEVLEVPPSPQPENGENNDDNDGDDDNAALQSGHAPIVQNEEVVVEQVVDEPVAESPAYSEGEQQSFNEISAMVQNIIQNVIEREVTRPSPLNEDDDVEMEDDFPSENEDDDGFDDIGFNVLTTHDDEPQRESDQSNLNGGRVSPIDPTRSFEPVIHKKSNEISGRVQSPRNSTIQDSTDSEEEVESPNTRRIRQLLDDNKNLRARLALALEENARLRESHRTDAPKKGEKEIKLVDYSSSTSSSKEVKLVDYSSSTSSSKEVKLVEYTSSSSSSSKITSSVHTEILDDVEDVCSGDTEVIAFDHEEVSMPASPALTEPTEEELEERRKSKGKDKVVEPETELVKNKQEMLSNILISTLPDEEINKQDELMRRAEEERKLIQGIALGLNEEFLIAHKLHPVPYIIILRAASASKGELT